MEDRNQQQQQPVSSSTATAAAAAAASALVIQALRMLPLHMTVAYADALILCPDLVQQESDPVLYLRKCNMNVQNAAIMIAMYWTKRRSYFGSHRTYLPLMTSTTGTVDGTTTTDTALSPLDMATAIPKCCLQVLPRDRMGHAVYYIDTSKITFSLSSEQGIQCLFYQLQRANNTSILSSTEGIILLWHLNTDNVNINQQHQVPQLLEAFVNLLSGLVQQAMPINVQRIHIITCNPTNAITLSLTRLVFAKFLCEECVVMEYNASSQPQHSNLPSKLLFYGISEDCLPMELGGSYPMLTTTTTTTPQQQDATSMAQHQRHRGLYHPAAATPASSQLLFQDFSNAPLLHTAAGLYPRNDDDQRTIPLGTTPPPRATTAAAAAAASSGMMPTTFGSSNSLQQEQDYSTVVAALLRQRKQQNWLEASMLDAKMPATATGTTARKPPPTSAAAASASSQFTAVAVGGIAGSGVARMMGGVAGELSEFSSRGSSNTSGRGAATAGRQQLKPVPPSYSTALQQQHGVVDEEAAAAAAAAERAEQLRQRNALYTRRSYHKSKIELQVLQDQVEQLRTQQQNLTNEQVRLQQLHQQVQQCLNNNNNKKQKTEHHPTAAAAPEAADAAPEAEASRPQEESNPPALAPSQLGASSTRQEEDRDSSTRMLHDRESPSAQKESDDDDDDS